MTKVTEKIKKLKMEIEEREKALYYSDSWEQSKEIRNDIEKMKSKLRSFERDLKTTNKSTNSKSKIKSKLDKNSVINKINYYKEKVKEQSFIDSKNLKNRVKK